MMKRNWMAQWTNLQRNNGFVNPTPFPMLCEKSGALHLAEPGLTAGRQAGRQADENAGEFKIFKTRCRLYHSTFCFV